MSSKQEEIEAALGAPVDWRKKMRDGVIVTLKIKHWRGKRKLSLEQLGVSPQSYEEQAAYDSLISLGSKLLLPQQVLRDIEAIEREARYNLAQYALETPFGMFVPYTTYTMWKEGNESYKARFFAKRDEIVAMYPKLIKSLLLEYEKIAKNTYWLLTSQDASIIEKFPTKESFVDYFRDEVIKQHIKSADTFSSLMIYEENLSRVPLIGTSEKVTDEKVEELSRIQQADIEAAEKHKAALLEMNRDLEEKIRQQKESQIDGFISAVMGQLRNLTYEVVSSVLTSIEKQKVLDGRPVFALKNMVEQLGQLNFYGDQDIEMIISSVQGIIDQPAKKRDVAQIQEKLRKIAMLSRGTLLAIGESPRAGREPEELGIIDEPSDDEMRRAREELYLGTLNIEDEPRKPREDNYLSITVSEPKRRKRTA